jgi:acetate---CoA ligase (ADP-forming)
MTVHTSSLKSYKADAVLRDGTSTHIRALRPEDKQRLLELFGRLSQRSVYFRFFRAKSWLSEAELAQLTELDFVHRAALVATLREGNREHFIGVGRYTALESGDASPTRAEVAFAVADQHQGRGIGTLLLEHLVPIARANGITEFEADVLGENNQMLDVFATIGFKVERSVQGGFIHVSFPTKETEEYAAVSHWRERHATAQSIRPILSPRSIAIVGASRQAKTIGNVLVQNVKGCGFTGAIYPVNPKAEEIEGLRCYPSASSIGKQVDLALVSVPAETVEEVIKDCARAGVRGLVIITSGFGEVSAEGRRLEKKLRELVRSSGMRMVGPNCMGVLNTDPEVALNATFVPPWPPPGNIGLLSQSGALGYVILERIQVLNIGLSTFVSVGNKADISGNDLLAYWSEDPRTSVIMLYLESFGNPRRFARLAPEIARRKPIVAVKSGRSAAGTRAASSHSAALASLDVAVDAIFEQAGVIRTDTLEQLLDVSVLLSTQPLPPGPRVGIITNAGGAGILLTDACEARGLQVPVFTRETQEQLRSFLPAFAGTGNPVDMVAAATTDHYEKAIVAAGNDPNIDSLIIIYLPPQLHPPQETVDAIVRAAGQLPAEKPVLTVFMSSRGAPPLLATGSRGRIPSYSFPENAAIALAAAHDYTRWRKRLRGTVLAIDAFSQAAVRAVVDRILDEHSRPAWIDPKDLATILKSVGITYAASEVVHVDEAVSVAERMGYPLVAKVQASGLLHKSDIGGVILGIRSREDLEGALKTLHDRMRVERVSLDAVLLQREIRGGIEALVGVTMDPTFGPLLVCGMGGVLVELLKDVAFHLTPVSDVDAAAMVAKLRAASLLDGYRGGSPGDRDALIDVIRRVSALVELVPEIRELDLNPVKVLEPGRGAIVVDGRMRIGPL